MLYVATNTLRTLELYCSVIQGVRQSLSLTPYSNENL